MALIKGSDILGQRTNFYYGRGPFSANKEYGYKPYDFRRPDKFSRDQIRTFQMMHETFARLITTSLSAQLRALVAVHVASVDQLTFDEFIKSIPNPTSLAVVNMDPLKGSAILEVNPSITFAVIDRLFGGQGGDSKLTREMTDIELSIMEGIYVRLLHNLRESWSNVLDLKPRLGNIETNPQFAMIVPPNNMVILVTLETSIGDVKGMMNFCVPYITIEPIMEKLSARYWYSSIRGMDKSDPNLIAGLKAKGKNYYEAGSLTLKETFELKKNSLLKIEGFKKGRIFLAIGEDAVLALNAVKDAKQELAEYQVINNQDKEVIGFEEILKPVIVSDSNKIIQDTLIDVLKTFSSDIHDSLNDLKKNFDSLKNSQEEMSDRIGLSGEGNGKEHKAVALLKPFDFIRQADPQGLFNFIINEHPQTLALILSQLDKPMATTLLSWMDNQPELRSNIIERIALMDRVSPDVLREIERVLERKLKTLTEESYTDSGGVDTVVELMNISSRSVEKSVIEDLEKRRPDLAEEIKQRMFVFENITVLDKRYAHSVLEKVQTVELALALKATAANIQEFVFLNCSKEKAESIRKEMEHMGPVRLNEVEKAQQNIVNLIRRMEENGEIIVTRADEKVI